MNLDLSEIEVLTYNLHNYGDFFYKFVIKNKPKIILELGSYMGYSGIHFASGLKENNINNSQLILVDLWSNYSYKKCSRKEILNNFKKNNFDKENNLTIFFIEDDAFSVIDWIANDFVDLIHIDLSNDGELLKNIINKCYIKLKKHGHILFEGGSEERDNVELMKKYRKTPIRKFLKNKWFNHNFEWYIKEEFPSLTICKKI